MWAGLASAILVAVLLLLWASGQLFYEGKPPGV
jgi:hypothetical protein